MSKLFSIVVAATQKGGIGFKGALPWPRLKADMKHFAQTTTVVAAAANAPAKRNAVVMGRVTFDSLPAKFKPLGGRINVVVSRTLTPGWNKVAAKPAETTDSADEHAGEFFVAPSFDAALAHVEGDGPLASLVEDVFVIGGADIYQTAIKHPRCSQVLLTRVLREFPCDRFFDIEKLAPGVFSLDTVGEVLMEEGVAFQMQTWRRPIGGNPEEQQYLDLVARVIREGNLKGDRTGTGTLSLFGTTMRFSLRDGKIPLFTTKRVFWRGVIEELLWLIAGKTSSTELAQRGVHIWDGNGSKQYLESIGLDYAEGDLGPVYGHQWRRYNAKYIDCHTDYTGQGIDQLANIINTIKTNPNDRRILMSAWNPCQLKEMALPPCHVLCQFYVSGGELSCIMYQRSSDLGLGIPFNVASYSVFTSMLAHVCGLKPKEFIHVMADTHVYSNHVEALKEQVQRTPSAFPTLKFKRQVNSIDDFQFDDFELKNYSPQKAIKMDMAV